MKRAGVESKGIASSGAQAKLRQLEAESAMRKQTSPRRGFRSLLIFQENLPSDDVMEAKDISNEQQDQRDGDDSTETRSHKEENSQDRAQETPDFEERTSNNDRNNAVLIEALSRVEFQDDTTDQVLIFDSSQSRNGKETDVQEEVIQNPLLPKSFVEIDSMLQMQNSPFVVEQPVENEVSALREAIPSSPTTPVETEEEEFTYASDWETVQHSVQNETMSEVSPLTLERTGSTSTSYSISGLSCSTYSTGLYPDVLMVRTKTHGTHVTNISDIEEGSEKDDESDIENQDDGESNIEEEYDYADDDENASAWISEVATADYEEEEEENCSDDDEEEEGESESEDEDEETSATASSFFSFDEEPEMDALHVLQAIAKKDMNNSEDAFVDLLEVYLEGESLLDDDDESAYTTDDNNVPFVDPIGCKAESESRTRHTPEEIESSTMTEKDEKGSGWKLFGGMLSYQ